jgi:hypothetical protein
MSRPALTVYVDAGLLADGGSDALNDASDLGLAPVVVDGLDAVPESLPDAWLLTTVQPTVGSPRWSRTILIGPRLEPGRVAVTGLRTARDLRLALLELASEHATD